MYHLDWVAQIRSRRSRSGGAPPLGWRPLLNVSPTVWRLGFTSLLTDVSSEMVSSILPLYFVLYLHFSPLEFGLLDGISQGVAVSLLSLIAGVMADRWRRQKEVAIAGYGLSALSRIGLLAAGSLWGWIAGVLVLDRVGKGIRTAPRDAMISLSSSRDKLATAFAVHRGLDTCGAIFGPLAAFLVLRSLPGAFDLILVASFFIALLGVGVICLLVDRPTRPAAQDSTKPTLRLSFGLLRLPRYRFLVIAAGMLGLATASDSFIYLLLQSKTKSSATSIPLYAFFTAVFYLLLSVPAGHLADRWGRGKVFLTGYGLLALIYAILLSPEMGSRAQFVVVSLFGAYYAATDGVLAAMTSAALSAELRTSGLALLNTATSLARLVSSVLFGWLWTSGTMRTAVGTFLLGLTAAIILSAWILADRRTA
jgi:MFS family permease